MMYVVLGTNPDLDTTVVVGPFRNTDDAGEAWKVLTSRGYVAETCPLWSVDEIETLK